MAIQRTDTSKHQPGQVIVPEGFVQSGQEPKQKVRSKLLKWFVLAVFLSVVAGLLVWKLPLLKTQGAVSIANQFINEAKDKDVDSAYSLTTAAYQSKQSKEELSKAANSEIFSRFSSADGRIENRKVVQDNPQKAEITYIYELNNRPYRLVLSLVKEEAGWKVDEVGLDAVRALESTQPGLPGQE